MSKFLENHAEISKTQLEEAIANAVIQAEQAVDTLGVKFKPAQSTNDVYPVSENIDWTEGFYTGELWIAYELSGKDKFKETALAQIASYRERLEKRIFVDHHDMGFLFSPSCVAAYKLTGDDFAKQTAIMAADNLISRFQPVGNFIQAWGELGAKDNYRLIIDCLLNLPLLYWASEVSGDEKYADIAKKHITTALKCVLREDDSAYHTHFFDTQTGEPTVGVTHQGYRDGSAWARGQAWGVYGIALSYKYTKNPEYIEKFKRVTDFFIEHLPKDLIPYWDFDFTDGTTEPKDSSSAAIAVCGILEMAKYLPANEAEYYTSVAKKILKSLAENYTAKAQSGSNGQLLHGVYARSSEYNTCPNLGVDECNTWGDYYYIEALIRLDRDWELYW